jgi:hypothetical protein
MDPSVKKNIAQLRIYLNNLSQKIPNPPPGTSKYNFGQFSPSPEWVTDIGEEHAVNRELEVRLGSRAKGPVKLLESGPGISAVSDVLEKYLSKYPKSVLLEKWLSDLLESARLTGVSAEEQVRSYRKKL